MKIALRDDASVAKLPVPKKGQTLFWDRGTRGLSVLVSCHGAKAFRSQFRLNGKWTTRTIGRFGDMIRTEDGYVTVSLEYARDRCRKDRADALSGVDPRIAPTSMNGHAMTFGEAIGLYVERYAKLKQKSWRHTERLLRVNCRDWLDLSLASITRQQTRDLLETFRRDGHSRKAKLTLSWLRSVWRFLHDEELVPDLLMDRIKFEHVKTVRDRTFDDAELKSIWLASLQLTDMERDFIQILLLTAPRKSALAGMRREELDSDVMLWTTPTERVKQRKSAAPRVYLTPLPPLVSSIFQRRLDAVRYDVLFPGVSPTKPFFPGPSLQGRVQRLSGVKDWAFHTHRHTTATWLQNRGHSLHDIGLILNHSASGVTAGYAHGYPLEHKLTLLRTWTDHIEELTSA